MGNTTYVQQIGNHMLRWTCSPSALPLLLSIDSSLLKWSDLTIYSPFVEGFVKGRVLLGFLLVLQFLCFWKVSGSCFCWRISQVDQWVKVFSAPDERGGHISHTTFSRECIGKINENQCYQKQVSQRLFKTNLLLNPVFHPIMISALWYWSWTCTDAVFVMK